MAITEAIRQERKKYIGASDISALFGCSPWATAYDLWAEKTGRMPDEDKFTNDAMLAGNMFEDGVIQEAASRIGEIDTDPDRMFLKDQDRKLCANMDGILLSTKCPVEAKTAGFQGPPPDYWFDAGEVCIPDHVICQVQQQIMLMGADHGYVAAFITSGHGFHLWPVDADPDMHTAIETLSAEFWDHVKTDTPPDATPSIETVQKIHRVQGSTCDISMASVELWDQYRQDRLAAEKLEKAAKADMLKLLGDCEVGFLPDGSRLEFNEVTRKAFQAKAFQQDYPELYVQYMGSSPYRKVYWKGRPKG